MARTWGYAIALVIATSVLVATSVLIGVQLSRPKPSVSVAPTGIVWEDRTFLSKAALRTWLRSRGADYTQWARHHPAAVAALEHRTAPINQQQSPATPVGLRRGHLSFFSGVWLVGCLALGAALVSRDDRPHRSRLSRTRRRQVVDWIERAHPDEPARVGGEAADSERGAKAVDLSAPMAPELVVISDLRAGEIAALPELAPIPPPPDPPSPADVEQRPVATPKAKPRRKRSTPPEAPPGKT
jgi:hypothetical protein